MRTLLIIEKKTNNKHCVDQTNTGYSIEFKNGVLQGSLIDSEKIEFPVIQYTVLKKQTVNSEDSPEVSKNGSQQKSTKILKVEYKAPKFKLTVDYSQKVKWKQSSYNGKTTEMIDAKNPAYPATAVINGKTSQLFCED